MRQALARMRPSRAALLRIGMFALVAAATVAVLLNAGGDEAPSQREVLDFNDAIAASEVATGAARLSGNGYVVAPEGRCRVTVPLASVAANDESAALQIWAGGGAGVDTTLILGGDGNDEMGGDRGDDAVIGGPGNDAAYGGFPAGDDGDDLLVGGDGNDTLAFAGTGTDRLLGGAGDDRLQGGPGNDILDGGDGNDTVGHPWVDVETGDDRLRGGRGDDALDGGPGFDALDGQDGTDSCINGERDQGCELP